MHRAVATQPVKRQTAATAAPQAAQSQQSAQSAQSAQAAQRPTRPTAPPPPQQAAVDSPAPAAAPSAAPTNASTQIKWGLGYIKGTYGSPCAAWSHEQADGWY